MVGLNVSESLIKDFLYAIYRKEYLLNSKGIVLTEEIRNQLLQKKDLINQLSEKDLTDIKNWIIAKLKTLDI